MERKLLFIINPNAGKRISTPVADRIRAIVPESLSFEIILWDNKDDFEKIVRRLCEGKFTEAIAVGGDGTVNRVAAALVNSPVALGILPLGSGNGLARSLSIPMQLDKAIQQIVNGRKEQIDYGTVNGIPFFCTSGVGFDAHIGNLFATSVKRGLQSYVKITVRELLRYRAKEYELHVGDKIVRRKAFLITVANAGQYGNDFYIAPQASMTDGQFHVVVIKPFNVLRLAGLMRRILTRKAFLARSIETYTGASLRIVRTASDTIHYDGEPAIGTEDLRYINHPRSLTVIAGELFNPSPAN